MFTSINLTGSNHKDIPAWGVMWSLAFVIYALCKVITFWPERRLTLAAACIYLFGWPGLDARPFQRRQDDGFSVSASEWLWAFAKTSLGIMLIASAIALPESTEPLLVGWIGMIGLVFLLHFGLFDLLACIWRTAGYDVQPLMDAPHRSTSLTEFWSRRWNRAFRDLSNRFLLRPLLPVLGVQWAMLAVFLFSGIVHDVVISLPAGGGYGLPTLYFVLQAIGILTQRTSVADRWGLNVGIGGWVVTSAWLIVPLPLLFHAPFVTCVIVPFLNAIGRIIENLI